jgi:hypothetical protein
MNKTLYQRLWSLAKASTVIVFLLGGAQVAMADVAANHIVRNTATVNYTDAGGLNPLSDTDFVDITINLVAAAPDADFDAAASTQDLAELGINQVVSIVFDVTSNANGVDTYTVDGASSGTGSVSFDGSSPGSPVELGGTVYSGAAAITAATFPTGADDGGITFTAAPILVASDDNSSGNITNGLAVNDFVRISDGVCQVQAVTEDVTVENGSTTLSVDRCVGVTADLTAGAQIGEQVQVTLTYTALTAGAIDITPDFTSVAVPAETTPATVATIILATDLRIHKFVRNSNAGTNAASVSYNPTCGTGTACLIVAGVEYFKAGVTADPGHTLEYALLVYNAGGIVTNVKVTDPIVAFTSYVVTTTDLVADGTAADTTGTDPCLNPLAGAGSVCTITGTVVAGGPDDTVNGTGFVYLDGTTLTVAAGHDGGGSIPATTHTVGGQVDGSKVSVVLFDVEID